MRRVLVTLAAGPELLARGAALLVHTLKIETPLVDAGEPLPGPDASEPFTIPFFRDAIHYGVAMEGRIARGRFGSGRVAAWMRMRVPLVPGATPSPMQPHLRIFDARPRPPVGSLDPFALAGLALDPDALALPAEQAFLAALLQGIGTLVLVTHAPNQYAKIQRLARAQRRPVHEVEEELLGVSHAEIGAYLLGLWGLPYPVIEAVAHHHHPSRVPDQSSLGPITAVHIASYLASAAATGAAEQLDEEHLRALGVAERLPEWRALAAEETAALPAT